MKRFILRGTLLAIAVVTFSLSYSVHAQELPDQAKDVPGDESKSAAGGLLGALPLENVMASLQHQGYSDITDLAPSPDGHALQAMATDPHGSRVGLLINATTGLVLSSMPK